MPSLLRRLCSTGKLRHPLSIDCSLASPEFSPAASLSPPPSPTKLRAAPPRRGYEALEPGSWLSGDEPASDRSQVDIESWALDEGDAGGELGGWLWVEVVQQPESPRTRSDLAQQLVDFRFPRLAPRPPSEVLHDEPPLIPLPTSSPLLAPPNMPTIDARLTPTKRKASMSSPASLSPTDSFTSCALPPSSPGGTSLSSLGVVLSTSTAASSISLSLTIATRIDSNGHRVLTSRRRLSLQPSPSKARRNKDAYGIGDEASDDDGDEADEVRFGKVVRGDKVFGASGMYESPGTGLGLFEMSSEPHAAVRQLVRPPRSTSLQGCGYRAQALPHPLAIAHQPSEHGRAASVAARPVFSEHQPIKTFTPPPPLAPPSPTKSSAFATLTLTRSNTTYSNAPASPNKRRNSLQPRRSFRRLSLSRASASYGPPLSATFSPSHDRRASAPALPPLSSLERHTSVSSLGCGALSVPPTPEATSSSSHCSFGTGASCSTSEPLLGRSGSSTAAPGRRTSLVSFELPPASPTEMRRALLAADARDEGYSIAHSTSQPPLSPSSSFVRAQAAKKHASAAREGAALQASVLERSWVPLDEAAERELERGRLVVVNPDLTPAVAPDSPTPVSSPPGTSTSARPERPARPPRPPKSLARRSAPSSTFSPPAAPLPHQIGIAC